MICVLVVAAGAAWEPVALRVLADQPEIVVLKRCVDVDDLLAAATAGTAHVAVVALDAPGLDGTAVEHLRRHNVRPVAVVAGGLADADQGRMRAHRIGIATLVGEHEMTGLPVTLTADDTDELPGPLEETPLGEEPEPARPGRVIAVWGPQGAPGRTTVAAGIAGVLAGRGVETVLVDADPYGGAVAQQLGVLDEVSGVLAAARLASSGLLEERLGTVRRRLGRGLSLVTGLPRADRWIEVRSGALEHLLEALREQAHVVVDTGFSIEDDPGTEFGARPGRNTMTLGALAVADEVVVVGSSDPVGLSRLARALVDLRDVLAGTPVRVVVNRSRSSLGWSERDIAGMVEGFARISGMHFLPDDQAAVDRALVAGRTLAESGDSPLLRALGSVASALVPDSAEDFPTSRLRRRRAGRAHRR
jgi:MinD-like ATPase involved in chromosome partitioning or flagellar assembly